MSTANEIAAAFERVDELLEQATAAAPAVALLLERAQERGITERQLAAHLGLNATVVMWLLKLAPDATADRSIDLGDDLGELLLRWARRV
jgi:plasmid maintenance system antidote protein VapI